MASYQLIDSGNGRKLERFGPYTLSRPAGQAVWPMMHDHATWTQSDLVFTREEENRWVNNRNVPASWTATFDSLILKIAPTDFGHVGVFPEQQAQWHWMREYLKKKSGDREQKPTVLNLFAYSGGATLACSQAGAAVCHLDASKGMVAWARENAALNRMEAAPIRWIVDDVMKFCAREIKRQRFYDAIILDPPSFGRGPKGELFKIEDEIQKLMQLCVQLLSDRPLFMLLSCHTPGFTPQVLHNLLHSYMKNRSGSIHAGEMMLENDLPLPSGCFARWTAE